MRSFLAIPLPPPLQHAAIEAGRARVTRPSEWRFVREDAIHLTIRFLGEVEPSRRAALDQAWRLAAEGAGPLSLTLDGVGAFPNERRPRVLWIGLIDRIPGGALAHLADKVERAARAAGFAAEQRPFTPHVTLARARPGARGFAAPPVSVVASGDFTADRLILYRSELGPGGARYHEEASFPFVSGSAS